MRATSQRGGSRPASPHRAGSPRSKFRHQVPASKSGRARKVPAAARRQDILNAALTVFAERGFEAARLDDVAKRAGVAKGTLYLYFRDKEQLFEELIRGAVHPIFEKLSEAASAPKMTASRLFETFFALFQEEILGTRRKLLLRLIISEGPRFPALAEFYYREVVTRGLRLMRGVTEGAIRKGELRSDATARFPQLIVAPLLLAVIWDGLFAKIEPLDVDGLLRAHHELLTGASKRAAP